LTGSAHAKHTALAKTAKKKLAKKKNRSVKVVARKHGR
jgi:hypothetical protein